MNEEIARRNKALVELRIKMAKSYENEGLMIPEIMEKYREEYALLHDDYKELTHATVARNITAFCSEEALAKKNEELAGKVSKLRKSGLAYSSIAKQLGISENKTRALYTEENKRVNPPREEPNPITKSEIENLVGSLKEGEAIETMVEKPYLDTFGFSRCKTVKAKVKIIKLYPFGAETDHGFLRYGDMARMKRRFNERKA